MSGMIAFIACTYGIGIIIVTVGFLAYWSWLKDKYSENDAKLSNESDTSIQESVDFIKVICK